MGLYLLTLIPYGDTDTFQLNLFPESFPPTFFSFLLSLFKSQIIATQFQVFLEYFTTQGSEQYCTICCVTPKYLSPNLQKNLQSP